jgi:3-phenylpropionate/trans-cinnamate dioxygenase ferredoxin reductase component
MTRRTVLVGGGLAAARCVEELRRRDADRDIVVVGAEDLPPYDRPPLTKAFLRDGGAAPLLGTDWTGIDLRLGIPAVGLDLDAGEVRLRSAAPVGFDDLVIATGARPRRLPGLEGPGVHTIRTVADADALRADLRHHGRVVVVGGGFIGCEVATTARSLGAEVVLIEALAAPLARVLGEIVGNRVADLHRAQGVEVLCGAGVAGVEGTGATRALRLTDGREVPAPIVVVGLGVAPETGWLAGSGLRVDDGILCDATGRASDPRVFAAGDVARWARPAGGSARHEHWTAAGQQGRVVAGALLGDEHPLDDVPYVWSDQAGVTLQLLGSPQPGDDVALIEGERSGAVSALYGRAGTLVAAFGIGTPRLVLRQRAAIAAGADYRDTLASAGITTSR